MTTPSAPSLLSLCVCMAFLTGCNPSEPTSNWTPEPTRVTEKLGWTEPVDLERSPYFPLDEERIRGLSPFVIDEWFPPHWEAMELPPLYARAGETGVEIYRFAELPTWGRPYAVTLEIEPAQLTAAPWLPPPGSSEPGPAGQDATAARHDYGQWARRTVGQLHYVVQDGSGGYRPGKIAARGESLINQRQAAQFRELFDAADLWHERTGDPNLGPDGTQWVLEFLRDGRYHVVDRWTPVQQNQPKPGTEGFVKVAKWLRDAAVPASLRP